MRKLITLAALTVLASAGAAVAAPAGTRLSDSQFMAAYRCAGLTQALGGDSSAIEAMLKAQRAGRASHVADQAKDQKKQAERDVRRADAAAKQQLSAERDSACLAYSGGGTALAQNQGPSS